MMTPLSLAVQAIKDGAMNFIQKPFRDQQLLDYINDALKLDAQQRAELLGHKEILRRLSCKFILEVFFNLHHLTHQVG
jgi:FixJ family two-component response regulator